MFVDTKIYGKNRVARNQQKTPKETKQIGGAVSGTVIVNEDFMFVRGVRESCSVEREKKCFPLNLSLLCNCANNLALFAITGVFWASTGHVLI